MSSPIYSFTGQNRSMARVVGGTTDPISLIIEKYAAQWPWLEVVDSGGEAVGGIDNLPDNPKQRGYWYDESASHNASHQGVNE